MKISICHKIIIISLLILLGCSGFVSAYYLNLDTPAEVKVGDQIQVQGSTNIPPPEKVDVVLSYSSNIPVEVARQSAEITEKGDTIFNLTFNTTGLEKGTYKVEAMAQTLRDYSGGSRSLRIVKIIDRSDLITLSSPAYQEFDGNLLIEARISDYDEKAIQMEVKRGNTSVFGPEPIPVDHGFISYTLPIKEPGNYSVSFTDYSGFIGSYPVQVTKSGSVAQAPAAEVTEQASQKTATSNTSQESNTTKKTAEPAKNTSDIQRNQTAATNGSEKDTPNLTSEVSRDNPAYILVTGTTSPVTIRTAPGADIMLEYKTTPSGAAIKKHDGGKNGETVSITDNVSQIYLKVYPYSFKSTEEATLYASNAEKIELSDKAAVAFGAPPRYSKQGSPLPVWIALLAVICGAVLIRRK